jgi:Family of unknown function (DUF5996)
LWTQIVGKIRLLQTPWLNHSWHVALYVTARGLTTSPIPFSFSDQLRFHRPFASYRNQRQSAAANTFAGAVFMYWLSHASMQTDMLMVP